MLIALAPALKGGNPPTPSTHRLRHGLPGYLILFATHAFEPQRQLQTRQPPSPLVFFHLSTHSTATHGVPLSSSALKSPGFRCTSSVKPKAWTSDLSNRVRAHYAQRIRITPATYVLPRLLARS